MTGFKSWISYLIDLYRLLVLGGVAKSRNQFRRGKLAFQAWKDIKQLNSFEMEIFIGCVFSPKEPIHNFSLRGVDKEIFYKAEGEKMLFGAIDFGI